MQSRPSGAVPAQWCAPAADIFRVLAFFRWKLEDLGTVASRGSADRTELLNSSSFGRDSGIAPPRPRSWPAPSPIRPAKVRVLGACFKEVRPEEIGLSEIRGVEERQGPVRITEFCTREPRGREVRQFKIRFAQVHSPEIGTGQVRADKTFVIDVVNFEVDRVLLAKRIPRPHISFEEANLLILGHWGTI